MVLVRCRSVQNLHLSGVRNAIHRLARHPDRQVGNPVAVEIPCHARQQRSHFQRLDPRLKRSTLCTFTLRRRFGAARRKRSSKLIQERFPKRHGRLLNKSRVHNQRWQQANTQQLAAGSVPRHLSRQKSTIQDALPIRQHQQRAILALAENLFSTACPLHSKLIAFPGGGKHFTPSVPR